MDMVLGMIMGKDKNSAVGDKVSDELKQGGNQWAELLQGSQPGQVSQPQPQPTQFNWQSLLQR